MHPYLYIHIHIHIHIHILYNIHIYDIIYIYVCLCLSVCLSVSSENLLCKKRIKMLDLPTEASPRSTSLKPLRTRPASWYDMAAAARVAMESCAFSLLFQAFCKTSLKISFKKILRKCLEMQ